MSANPPAPLSDPNGKPDYTTLDFPPAPDGRPYVILNMVASLDGKVTVAGTERGLGSPADQRLMRELRVHADVVLNGAGTLRASGTSSRLDAEELEALRLSRGLARQPVSAVISRSGNLPLERAFFTKPDEFEAVVYLGEHAPPQRRAAIAATGRTIVDLPQGDEVRAALTHMHDALGAKLLLVEGGPTINGELFRLDLVDEFFLTLGPIVVGGRGGLTAVENDTTPAVDALQRLALIHAIPNRESGEIYLRYRVPRD